MKNIKKIGKYGKRVAALVLAMVMLFGTAAMVVGVINSAFADEDDSYSFVGRPLDVEFYMTTYPDVVAAVGTDPFDLWMHYWDHGMAEGRIPYPGAEPGAFVDGYTEPNADVTAATETTGNTERDLSDWTPEQLAMLAQKQAEFDASGLVHVGWTEAQVYDRLMWIKDNLYPEGTKIGTCSIGAGRIGAALYGADMDWLLDDEQGCVLCDKNGIRVMPVGFVRRESVQRSNGGNIRDVRVGDAIYTIGSGTGHVMFVLTHDEKGITVAESNQNGDEKMHWGRRISWEELENGGNNIYKAANKWTEIESRMY